MKLNLIDRSGNVVVGIMVAVVVTALVAGGLTYSWQKKQGDDKVMEVAKQAEEAKTKASELEQKISELQAEVKSKMAYNFKLETFSNDVADKKIIDSKIVKVYEDGSQELVVASTKEKIDSVLCSLTEYNKDNFLYFKTCTPDSDDAKGKLVVYDVDKGELRYLENVNKIYIGWGLLTFSPDKKLAIYVPNTHAQNNMIGYEGLDQHLYLLNLLADSSEEIVTLSGLESFNKGCGALGSIYEISWLTGNEIQYSVFNKAKGNCVQNKEAGVTRKLEIK